MRKKAMIQLLLLTVLLAAGLAMDIKQKLEIPPPPLKGFNVNAYAGQWFIQFRKAPCSWSGSTMFTDFEQNVLPDGKASLVNNLAWRSRGMCNRVTGKYLVVGPGVFNNIDNIGDSFSGRLAVAATDYKKFVIYWGCTKMSSFGDRCEDPWISIATRNRFPSPKVINIIENILRARWGIFLGELQRISHKAPCQPNFQKQCKY